MEIKRYLGSALLVQWLTESRFGKTKFGIPIEKRSRHLAHVGRVLYGTELGSVTLKINNQQRESHVCGDKHNTHFEHSAAGKGGRNQT
jgi:hypothetical protein